MTAQLHTIAGLKTGQLPSPQIRLLILTQFYPPDYAATGQLVEELATRFAKQGIWVQIFTGQPSYAFSMDNAPAREAGPNLSIWRSRTSRLWPQRIRGRAVNGLIYFVRAGLYILRRFNRHSTLLITTEPPYLCVLGYLFNLVCGQPYICLLYDLYPDVAVKLNVISSNHWLTRIWRSLNRQVWRNARQIIVLSRNMKAQIVAQCPEVADKVSIIHSWSDPSQIVPIPKRENWFAWKHKLVNSFTVLYSGNMGRCHDMDTILEAAELLKDEPIRFVFIGRGVKQKDCEVRAKERQLENCQFLDYQDKETLPYSLTACDLSLVSVSPGMEGLVAPSKLYGMLAAGRPIAAICPTSCYLADILSSAQCGRVFANGDAKGLVEFLRILASDRELAAKMGEASRRCLLQRYTPEAIARQYVEVLQASADKSTVASTAGSGEVKW
jgi:glycosyltransferase involved in cell wall biosynthesis